MKNRKKLQKAKKIELFDPVYESYITCFVGKRASIIEGILKTFNISNRKFIEEHVNNMTAYAETMVFASDDDENVQLTILWFDENELSEHGVAHEFIHAASRILRERGINHTDETEEAYTYLVGYFIREFYKKLRGK